MLDGHIVNKEHGSQAGSTCWLCGMCHRQAIKRGVMQYYDMNHCGISLSLKCVMCDVAQLVLFCLPLSSWKSLWKKQLLT